MRAGRLAHSMTHRILATLSAAEQRVEIDASREAIVRRLGECATFAYPNGQAGDFTEETISIRFFKWRHEAVAAIDALEPFRTTVLKRNA